MQYLGGKTRLANQIVNFIESQRSHGQTFLEPFCGGCNITALMSGSRIASDAHPYLIALYTAMQAGWVPPDEITEADYIRIKANPDDDPALTAFVGFGCSFGAKWFGGYARNGKGDNYALRARNGLLRKMATMGDVTFECKSYAEWNPSGMLIYCDPPYKGATGYNGVGAFDHDLFWSTMREWSKSNSVYVSEYNAPDGWECVWAQSVRLSMHDASGGNPERVEKIFNYYHKVN